MSIITLNTRSLPDGAVTTAKIASDAVTDAKIADDVIGTEHLTAGEVDTTALGADAVTEAKIADDAVESEHLNDNIISGQTALTSSPDDTDELLISDAGTIKRIDVSLVGGKNTPAFQARNSADQDIGYTGNFVKITCNTEIFDTDSKYDNSSNYRFTPTVAGKYFCYGSAIFEATSTSNNGNNLVRVYLAIYKNGSAAAYSQINRGNQDFAFKQRGEQVGAVLDLDADDYIELYAMADSGVAGSTRVAADASGTYFGAYKIIT